jgi:hypothetical protein
VAQQFAALTERHLHQFFEQRHTQLTPAVARGTIAHHRTVHPRRRLETLGGTNRTFSIS